MLNQSLKIDQFGSASCNWKYLIQLHHRFKNIYQQFKRYLFTALIYLLLAADLAWAWLRLETLLKVWCDGSHWAAAGAGTILINLFTFISFKLLKCSVKADTICPLFCSAVRGGEKEHLLLELKSQKFNFISCDNLEWGCWADKLLVSIMWGVNIMGEHACQTYWS